VDAVERARDIFVLNTRKVGYDLGSVCRVEDILGTTEVVELLGVSRQRIHELRTAGRFPEPMVELAAGPIWLRSGIEAYLETWSRKAGRPRSRQFV
jgi:predicted DNA-binding transcriptional regulator AlpA